MALWNEQTSEQRFFTDAFDRDVMQQSIRIGGAAIDMQPWFRTVPARYQPHTAVIAERVYNAAIGKMLTTRLALALANELHDVLWTELVPIRDPDDRLTDQGDGIYSYQLTAAEVSALGAVNVPTAAFARAAESVARARLGGPATPSFLEHMLAMVVAPEHKLELIANATEPAIIRVAVTPPDQRIETAIGYYLKPHVAAGVGLFVDGGPVWGTGERPNPGPMTIPFSLLDVFNMPRSGVTFSPFEVRVSKNGGPSYIAPGFVVELGAGQYEYRATRDDTHDGGQLSIAVTKDGGIKPVAVTVAIPESPFPVQMPLRALTAEQLEEAAVECDRMLRDGQERDGQPAEYWARAVVGEQRRREEST